MYNNLLMFINHCWSGVTQPLTNLSCNHSENKKDPITGIWHPYIFTSCSVFGFETAANKNTNKTKVAVLELVFKPHDPQSADRDILKVLRQK